MDNFIRKLPSEYLQQMSDLLGEQYAEYLRAMETPFRRSLRVNTLKISVSAFLQREPSVNESNGIIPEGFLIPNEFAVGSNPDHAAGLFYMQESCAQYPAFLLDAHPGECVLDLCAAPGGKTSQLAASMHGKGLLIANEINPKRVSILNGTLERLGVRNALITCMRPDTLCPLLEHSCDAVLVDAPCSGEGMFRRDEQAIRDWSPAHVETCSIRQKAILQSAALTVKPGGRLVYSTCTFSELENEAVIKDFLENHSDFHLVSSRRLYPHNTTGEGQYAALLLRSGNKSTANLVPSNSGIIPNGLEELFFDRSLLRYCSTLPDNRVFLLPEFLPSSFRKMHVIRAGIYAGDLHSDRFIPAHCLAMAFHGNSFTRSVSLPYEELRLYLAGETIDCSADLSGFTAVCTDGFPVGFGKSVHGVLKNHLPKGLRLRQY